MAQVGCPDRRIHRHRPDFSFYFPLMTSLIISVVLSVILWLVNR
jgi:hypothetical protein